MSRYEPWQDHELSILYQYVNVRLAAEALVQLRELLPGRSAASIQNRIYKLREEAQIVLGGSHRPSLALMSQARASERLASAIENELQRASDERTKRDY